MRTSSEKPGISNFKEVVSSSMKRVLKSFQKIIVAYDDSPAAREALRAGIELCKLVGMPLETITVIEPPPIYSGLVLAVAPDVARNFEADRRRNYQQVMDFAVAEGRRHCVEVTGHVLEAGEVDGIVSFLRSHGADLLVIGLRQHSSHVARLWSTISSLEQEAPCNVLAIRAFSGGTVEGS